MRSVQTADSAARGRRSRQIWTPPHLERLARTYWRFLTRVTLGLIRVRYTERERSVVLLAAAAEAAHLPGARIRDGRHARARALAHRARPARRSARARRRRLPADRGPPHATGEDAETHQAAARLHVEVEVANFYPSIASRLSRRLYNATQSRIHVIVTYGFLRSLARLDLAESRVGRFAASIEAADTAG